MSKLSNFRSAWAAAPVMQAGEFNIPDDGKYSVVIENAAYTEKKQDGSDTDPTIVYTLYVQGGEWNGTRFRKYSTIRSEKSLGFIKGELSAMGFPIPSDPEEIPIVLASAKGIAMEITIKSRSVDGKAYKDVTFDKFLKKNAVSGDAANPAQTSKPSPLADSYYDTVPF